MQATLLLRVTKIWIITVIIFKQKKPKNPTGFGWKHFLKLLPHLWKSHSWASKPSCDHLKACLVKLCCLFVIFTANSSLDFNSECPSKCTRAEQTPAGSNGGKIVLPCPPPPASVQKNQSGNLLLLTNFKLKKKAEVFLCKKYLKVFLFLDSNNKEPPSWQHLHGKLKGQY